VTFTLPESPNLKLFRDKIDDLGLNPSKAELAAIVARIQKDTPSLVRTERLLEEATLRTYLQDRVLDSFLHFFIYLYGSSQVFDFQRKIIRYIETAELPPEWENVPDSFFRHSGLGWEGNICILIPRSLRKTTLGMALSVWFYLRNMDSRTMLTHNDFTLSVNNLSMVRSIVMLPHLVSLFPDRLKESRIDYIRTGGRIAAHYLLLTDKEMYPDLAGRKKEASIGCTSMNQDLTSQHYDLVIADDLVVYDTSKNELATAAVVKYFDSLSPLAVNLNKGIQKIVLGTQWCSKNFYEVLKQTRGNITFIQMPAAWGIIDEENFLYEHYLCPELLSDVGLKRQYADIEDVNTFWSQFFMRPIPLGGNVQPLCADESFVIPRDTLPPTYETFNVLAIDPISREKDIKRSNKSRGIALLFSVKESNAYIRIPYIFDAVPNVADLVDQLVAIIKNYNVDAVIVEKVHAQRWLGQLIKNKMKEEKLTTIMLEHAHNVSKGAHIYIESGLQALFDNGEIFVSDKEIALTNQIMGKAPFADEVDALSFVPSEVDNWRALRPKRKLIVHSDELVVPKSVFKGTCY